MRNLLKKRRESFFGDVNSENTGVYSSLHMMSSESTRVGSAFHHTSLSDVRLSVTVSVMRICRLYSSLF